MNLQTLGLILIMLIGVVPPLRASDPVAELQRGNIRLIENQPTGALLFHRYRDGYGYPDRHHGDRGGFGAMLEIELSIGRRWGYRGYRSRGYHGYPPQDGYREGLERGREETARQYEERMARMEVDRKWRELERKEAELNARSVKVLREEDVRCDLHSPVSDKDRVRIVNSSDRTIIRISGGRYTGENEISLGPGAEVCPIRVSNTERDAGFTMLFQSIDQDGHPRSCRVHLEGFSHSDTGYIVTDPDTCEVS